ncbi:hypothetical protein TSUD_378890 [Trifolium subterraneum]|uniref:Uncharacterized protein n=1 Tax=Trifolium subterraneum TaxID=3900 RepID=A0A2Z6NA87_TRISU|nr:hypothetical protein TSUD_378890 [Trifolium subterraneum]
MASDWFWFVSGFSSCELIGGVGRFRIIAGRFSFWVGLVLDMRVRGLWVFCMWASASVMSAEKVNDLIEPLSWVKE